jgi:hypothetical protein
VRFDAPRVPDFAQRVDELLQDLEGVVAVQRRRPGGSMAIENPLLGATVSA